jgi:pimeloyl-ACP methyl ester carboxylesterase
MVSQKATVLVVGGGWHLPQSYAKLTKQLESIGYEVQVPILPSMNGSRPPTKSLGDDTDHIRSVAEGLVNEGRDVVVLMHSYGGQVGTNALYGLGKDHSKEAEQLGGISRLIYMTAYAIQEGKAMIDGVKHFGHEQLMPLAFDFADDMSVVSRNPKTLLVGKTDLPAAEVDEYIASLACWNGQAMYQPLSTPRAAWRDIPVTYVHTTKDMTVPLDYQKWFVEGMQKEGIEVQTATLETGHCPNFTAAEQVTMIVNAVVKGELQSCLAGAVGGTSNESL